MFHTKNTIAYFLYEYDDIIHTQLLECFLDHRLLKSISDSSLVIDTTKQINGVFTPLSRCYSPRCQVNNVTCYSPLCPNKQIPGLLRIVQQTNNDDGTNMVRWIVIKMLRIVATLFVILKKQLNLL